MTKVPKGLVMADHGIGSFCLYLHLISCLLNGSPKSSMLTCKRATLSSELGGPYKTIASEAFVTS
uniref:HK1a2 n=1 Tax=Arundo donax TaxID=35708 RepID=A0A0A9EUL7_ARUDO